MLRQSRRGLNLERNFIQCCPGTDVPNILQELQNRFGAAIGPVQATRDGMPTLWVERNRARDILRYLKLEVGAALSHAV